MVAAIAACEEEVMKTTVCYGTSPSLSRDQVSRSDVGVMRGRSVMKSGSSTGWLCVVALLVCATLTGCGGAGARTSKAKPESAAGSAAQKGPAIGGKDVSRAVFAGDKPPKVWKKATYGNVPGVGEEMPGFPVSLKGPLTPEWRFVLRRASAWGVAEFKGDEYERGQALVIASPDDELTQKVLGNLHDAFAERNKLADVGDESFVYDYKDQWKHVGYLVFRRGRTLVYLSFDGVDSKDLVSYAKQLDARVQSVLGSDATPIAAGRLGRQGEDPITWTRDDPRALAAVRGEGGPEAEERRKRVEAEQAQRKAEQAQREQAAKELASTLRLTADEKSRLRKMQFGDCLTKEQKAAMRKPQTRLSKASGWQYVQVSGFGNQDEDGNVLDHVSGASGQFHEPETGRCVGIIGFRAGPLDREFSDADSYWRICPTDERLAETFEFDEAGRLKRYARYLTAETIGSKEQMAVDEVVF